MLLIGSEGNMGNRYRSILKYLAIPFDELDVHNQHETEDLITTHDKIIIASSTNSHFDLLRMMPGKTVLCEKPITKNIFEIKQLSKLGVNLSMVNNYSFAYVIANLRGCKTQRDLTYYNYYNTGNDGLFFDCIQLFLLAKNGLKINTSSPVWECAINGYVLCKDDIDSSYVRMINAFFKDQIEQDMDDIINAHERAYNLDLKYGKDKHCYWNSGTPELDSVS